MDKIEKVLGPNRDIMAPDVNTNAQMMAWLMDEYGKLHGHTPAIVTGKPIALEGSYGREAATGRGLIYLFREAAPQLGLHAARSRTVRRAGLRQRRLVGGADPGPARREDRRRLERGRRDPQRRRHRRRHAAEFIANGGKLTEFEGAEPIPSEDLFAIPCDVLVPAALGGMIHEGNADSINCRILLEGANSPTTPGADELLTRTAST